MPSSSDNEVSIYSRDGQRVLLTHYCAMTPDGHVARLATAPLHGLQQRLEFAFLDATNLHDAAAPVHATQPRSRISKQR